MEGCCQGVSRVGAGIYNVEHPGMTFENENSEPSNCADKIKLFKTAKAMVNSEVLLKPPLRVNGWLVKWWIKFHVDKYEMRHEEKNSSCCGYKIMGFELTIPL